MRTPTLILFLLADLAAQEAAPAKPEVPAYPPIAQVQEAIKRAVSFARSNLSFAGGYATKWSRNLEQASTADRSGTALIAIEPPGTPSIGLAYVSAYRATGDPLYLQASREAAQALLWTQLASGGWATEHDYSLPEARKRHYRRDLEAGDTERGDRYARSTLDDGKTQSALHFLLELAHLPDSKEDAPLQSAVAFGLDALLAAQAPNGGWPQGYSGPADPTLAVKRPTLPSEYPRTFPALDYTGYYTLNDGNLRAVGSLLARGHELTGDTRFLEALKKLGDFLRLSQCAEPQPGWAQQYNLEMEPAWARKFEPPCISSLETLSALETLNDVWLATGDTKYTEPFPSALAWLKKIRLPDGQFARFQELHSDRPLYFVKDTYELTYDDSHLPTHYGFKIDDLQEKIDTFQKRLATTREEQLAKLAPPDTPRAWLSKAKGAAKKAVTALRDQNREGVWTDNNVIEAALLVKHLNAMVTYLEAAQKAGDEFVTFAAEQGS